MTQRSYRMEALVEEEAAETVGVTELQVVRRSVENLGRLELRLEVPTSVTT